MKEAETSQEENCTRVRENGEVQSNWDVKAWEYKGDTKYREADEDILSYYPQYSAAFEDGIMWAQIERKFKILRY